MTQQGWYQDAQDGSLERWWDGQQWTEHTRQQPAAITTEHADASDKRSMSLPATLALFVAFGTFVGLINGMFIFNSVSVLGPRTTSPGTITRLDLDFSPTGSGTNRLTHWVEGRFEDGSGWRFADKDLYEIADEEGYPFDVEVIQSAWTDDVVAVEGLSPRGNEIESSHGGNATGIMWAVGALIVTAGVLAATRPISRSEGGAIVGLTFVLSFLVLGSTLGYLATGWVRSA